MALKLKLKAAQDLLKECGYTEAGDYSAARTKKKVEGLPKTLDADNQPKSKDGKKLLKSVVEEMKGDGKIVIEDEEGAETEEVGEEKAPAKKADKAPAKKAKAEEPEEDDEDESDDEEEDEDSDDEDEEEDEESDDEDEEEEKPAKKAKEGKEGKEGDKKKGPAKGTKPPASAGGEGKPGIIASIVEFLQEATSENPISKKSILKKLCKRFPDRAEESMKKTVNVQVPNRISKDKKMEVEKDEKGYWINPDKSPSKSKDKAPAKKAKKEVEEDDE